MLSLTQYGPDWLFDPKIGLPVAAIIVTTTVLTRWLGAHFHRRRLARQLQCQTSGPCYPSYDPLFGLDYMYENGRKIWAYQFAQGVLERFRQYGSTYYALMGFQKIVHTIDPENYEAFMKTNFDDYVVLPDRSKLVTVLFGSGVFTHNGDDWKHSRTLVHWSMGNLNIDTNLIEKHARTLIEKLRAQSIAHPGQAVDFTAAATTYAFNVAAGLMFGDLPDERPTETSEFATDFANVNKIGQQLTLFIFMNMHLLFWNAIGPAQARLFHFVDTCVEKALAIPKKAGRKHDSVIEGLASQTNDVERIRSETLNLFLAGNDSVKLVLGEQFWYLARNPSAWRTLRTEVAALDGGKPTLSQLREMTYLRWINLEVARLNPTLSAHGRKAIRNTVLPRGGGPDGSEPLLVEKGTYVAYSNYALHRDPTVFGEDVDSFRPERWGEIAPGKFEYLGFGGGPRFCPGREFGWAIVAYATVRMAQEFETLERPINDQPWQEAPSFSFYNKNGCHMIVKAAREH